MLQTSEWTLQELHDVCGPRISRLWADPSLSLTRFRLLHSLTLRQCPSLGAFWLRRLPAGLRSLDLRVASHHHATASERRSASNTTLC